MGYPVLGKEGAGPDAHPGTEPVPKWGAAGRGVVQAAVVAADGLKGGTGVRGDKMGSGAARNRGARRSTVQERNRELNEPSHKTTEPVVPNHTGWSQGRA